MFKSIHLIALAAVAIASYNGNLNYQSPSVRHASLGISKAKVHERHARALPTTKNLNFTHGVASGDPYPTSVILWTRCAPTQENDASDGAVSGYVPLFNPVPIYDNDNVSPPSTAPVCLQYRVAKDRRLSKVVHRGRAFTSSDVDYTLKVLISFLYEHDDSRLSQRRSKRPVFHHLLGITTSSVSAIPTLRVPLAARRPHLPNTTALQT